MCFSKCLGRTISSSAKNSVSSLNIGLDISKYLLLNLNLNESISFPVLLYMKLPILEPKSIVKSIPSSIPSYFRYFLYFVSYR